MLPPEPGPYADRPIAKALLIGGVIGLPLIFLDLIRNPDRIWLWGSGIWIAMITWSAWSGTFGQDSDILQILGWGFILGGLVGLPLVVIGLAIELGRAVSRRASRSRWRWHVRSSGNSIEVSREVDASTSHGGRGDVPGTRR